MEQTTDNSLDLRRIWRQMRRLRWVYLGALVGLVGLVTVLIVRSLPYNVAYAKILIEDSSTDSGGGASINPLGGMMKLFSVGGFGSSSVSNERYIINSYDLSVRTVKAMGLTHTYVERKGLMGKKLLFPDAPLRATMDPATLDTMSKGVFVKTIVKPSGRIDAKVVAGPRFLRTTYSELKDAELPATLATPYGPLTLTEGSMPLDDDQEEMALDIIVLGVQPAAQLLYEAISTDLTDKLADVVELELEGGSREYCLKVLGEYLNQYNQRRIERRAENALSELRYYDARLADLAVQLNDAEKRMESFKADNSIVSIESEANYLVDNSMGKMSDVVLAQATIDYYRSVKATLEDASQPLALVPVVESLGNPMIANYNSLVMSRKALGRSAKEGNPQLAILDEQIADVKASLLKNVDGMLQQATLKVNAITGLMGSARSRLAKMPAYEREYIDLLRDRTLKNELYLFLMQKRENAALQVTSDTTLGFVIDPPYTPTKIRNFKPIIKIGLAVILALLLPTMLAVLLLWWRNRVEDASDLTAMHIDGRAALLDAPRDANGLAQLRQSVLGMNPPAPTVYVCNLAGADGRDLVDGLAASIVRIGRSASVAAPLADNDALLAPAPGNAPAPDNAPGAVSFAEVADCDHLAPYTDALNADSAAVMVVVKAGAVRRNVLKRMLQGIYADRVAVAILK